MVEYLSDIMGEHGWPTLAGWLAGCSLSSRHTFVTLLSRVICDVTTPGPRNRQTSSLKLQEHRRQLQCRKDEMVICLVVENYVLSQERPRDKKVSSRVSSCITSVSSCNISLEHLCYHICEQLYYNICKQLYNKNLWVALQQLLWTALPQHL